MNLPPIIQKYLDAWNAGDPDALLDVFAANASVVGNDGTPTRDLFRWAQQQAQAARAGAVESFGPARVKGKAVAVSYALTRPDGTVVQGTDFFFLAPNGKIRMLVWNSRP
jgi:hypothetical protein